MFESRFPWWILPSPRDVALFELIPESRRLADRLRKVVSEILAYCPIMILWGSVCLSQFDFVSLTSVPQAAWPVAVLGGLSPGDCGLPSDFTLLLHLSEYIGRFVLFTFRYVF